MVSPLAFPLLLALASPRTPARVPPPESEEKKELRLVSGLQAAIKDHADAKIQVARNLRKVRANEMDAPQFFAELGKMEMPRGLEPRHLLQAVKKDIGDHLGKEGLAHFLGATTPAGGSRVEAKLLAWRQQLVKETINEVLREFSFGDLVMGERYRIFMLEVGSWSGRSPDQLTFAGDIDFSFLCGDLDVSMRLKRAFDRKILAKTGLTAEALDTPCTPHGMASPEVFVGKSGQGWAESNLGVVWEAVPGAGLAKWEKSAQDALQIALLEGKKLADRPLPNIVESQWPDEPGVTLEMIRHFEHDIVSKGITGDIDSFMKACKYVRRSNQAVVKAGGTPANPRLAAFAERMVGLKEDKAHPVTNSQLVEEIRTYFRDIGQPMPLYVQLGPENVEGQRSATLKVKEEIIRAFWASCSTEMWHNARKGFRAQIEQLRSRARGVMFENAASVGPVAEEFRKMREQVEVEMRVLDDPTVGVHEIPADFRGLVTEFRTACKEFMVKAGPNFLPPGQLEEVRFIEEMIKAGQPSSLRLAVGALLGAPEKINGYLDVLDDKIMGSLRGETPEGWDEFLAREQKLRWAEKVRQVSEGRAAGPGTTASEQNAQRERLVQRTEQTMNKAFENLVAVRAVRSVNQSFNRSIRQSTGGQAVMKGLVLVSLKDEIPAYVHLMAEGKWRALGAEFFKRRVPFGVVVEDVFVSNYKGAAWDAVTTLVPPMALFETAAQIGKDMARETWRIAWDEALVEFIDGLYDSAVFEPRGAERMAEKVRLTNWQLVRVSYRSREVEVAGFVPKKRAQIREMQQAAADLTKKTRFPMEYTSDGITGWFDVDGILRETVIRKDPWLVLIEEMKKDRNVGPALMDHFLDLWHARWEELKLEFFIKIVATLEERRSATQLQVDGQAFEMFEELKRVTAALKIQKEVLAALEAEAGSDFMQSFYGIWDTLRGFKRSLTGGPRVWDAFDEKVRVFEAALRVYRKILDAREEAEKAFPSNEPREEQGVRLVTGTLFLSGKAQADEGGSERWTSRPGALRSETGQKLLEIKQRYVPGSALETKPDSFDQKTAGGIAYHALFADLWSGVPASAEKTVADAAPGRSRTHTEEVDRLLREFEAHYFQGRAAALLEELRKLAARAETLAQSALGPCAEADSSLAALQADAGPLEADLEALAPRLSALASRAAQARGIGALLLRSREEAERGAQFLAEYASKTEKRSLEICEATKAMQVAGTADQRDQKFRSVDSLKADLGPWLNECRNKQLSVKGVARRARADFAPVEALQRDLAVLKEVDALAARTAALEKILAAASAKVGTAGETAGQIAPVLARADQIAGQIRSVLEPARQDPAARKALDDGDRLQAGIESAAKRAGGAVENSRRLLEAARARLAALRALVSRATRDRASVQTALSAGGGDFVGQARRDVEGAEYMAEMGADYLTRIENAATDGAVCATLASDLNARPFTARTAAAQAASGEALDVPPVVGMKVEDAMNAVSRAGFVPDSRTIGGALNAQQAFTVTGQKPGPGEKASAGTPVVLFTLGGLDAQAALAAANCPGVYPGSYAVFNQQSAQVECACAGAWSADRKVCMDCNVQQNGFYGALSAGDMNGANAILAQSVNCPFYAAGNQQLWAAMQESYRRNAAEIELMEAQRRAADAEAQRRKQEQLGQMIEGFSRAVQNFAGAAGSGGGVAAPPPTVGSPLDAFFRQAGQGPASPLTGQQIGPPVPPRPTVAPPGSRPPSRPPAGRSGVNCEQQYCPMCAGSVDMLGQNLDPQCMQCRKSKANLIAQCQQGGAAPSAPEATPNTYYVGCQRGRDSYGNFRCGAHKIGRIEELMGYEIIHGPTTWGDCWNWEQANPNYSPRR